MRACLIATLLASAAAVQAEPIFQWTCQDLSDGWRGYTFTICGNDDMARSFFADLVFESVEGAEIAQSRAFGSLDVHSQTQAALYAGIPQAGYDPNRDSYLLEPFASNAVILQEREGYYHVAAGTGAASKYTDVSLAFLCASGDLVFHGALGRGGETYLVEGRTDGLSAGLILAPAKNPPPHQAPNPAPSEPPPLIPPAPAPPASDPVPAPQPPAPEPPPIEPTPAPAAPDPVPAPQPPPIEPTPAPAAPDPVPAPQPSAPEPVPAPQPAPTPAPAPEPVPAPQPPVIEPTPAAPDPAPAPQAPAPEPLPSPLPDPQPDLMPPDDASHWEMSPFPDRPVLWVPLYLEDYLLDLPFPPILIEVDLVQRYSVDGAVGTVALLRAEFEDARHIPVFTCGWPMPTGGFIAGSDWPGATGPPNVPAPGPFALVLLGAPGLLARRRRPG